MRYVRMGTLLLFVLCLGLNIGSRVWVSRMVDQTYPEISSSVETITLNAADLNNGICEGLSAYDEKDGDITENIMVEHISSIDLEGSCEISYVVFDQDNHSAQYKRSAKIEGYTLPHFAVERPLVFDMGSNFQFLDYVKAYDSIDGDISGKIKIRSSSIDSSYEGVYPVQLEVTDNYGNTSKIGLNIVVTSAQFQHASVLLSSYLVYLKQGAVYNPRSYISAAANADGESITAGAVSVTGHVNTDKPGIYQVSFSVRDEGLVYQTVVVE